VCTGTSVAVTIPTAWNTAAWNTAAWNTAAWNPAAWNTTAWTAAWARVALSAEEPGSVVTIYRQYWSFRHVVTRF
jgi:hypothetical protein